MATLRIFGDESGPYPIKDTDGPFVCATVSVLGGNPSVENKVRRSDLLVEQLVSIKAIAHMAYIYPKHGYGDNLAKKIKVENEMALNTRRTTGANKNYVPEKGINIRNVLWQCCMGNAILRAITSAISKTQVDRVIIVLDRMTWVKEHNNWFKATISRVKKNLDNSLSMLEIIYPYKTQKLRSNLLFSGDDMLIIFSDDPLAKGSEAGLDLVHQLALLSLRELRKSRNRKWPISEYLGKAGYTRFSANVTDILLKDFNPATIEKYKKLVLKNRSINIS